MYIEKSYKYEKDGIVYISGKLPEGVTALETMDILYAEDEYTLIRKSDGEDVSNSVWLKDGDTQDNYIEKEIIDG